VTNDYDFPETRRDKLLKWKAQKEALLLAQKASKKPPFKLGAFQGSAIKDIGSIPPPKSTFKSTIKRPIEDRSRQIKNPSAASRALAALSDNKRVTRSQAKSAQSSQVEVKPSAMSKPAPKAQCKPTAQQKAINHPSFAPANHVFKVNKIIVHC